MDPLGFSTIRCWISRASSRRGRRYWPLSFSSFPICPALRCCQAFVACFSSCSRYIAHWLFLFGSATRTFYPTWNRGHGSNHRPLLSSTISPNSFTAAPLPCIPPPLPCLLGHPRSPISDAFKYSQPFPAKNTRVLDSCLCRTHSRITILILKSYPTGLSSLRI